MEPLRGLVIPCDLREIHQLWQRGNVLERMKDVSSKLPKRFDEGLDGLRDDMLELAVFSQMRDGRINMPDVFRVGFGLGRRGGVKPIR